MSFLKQTLLGLAQSGTNHLLQLDPETLDQLSGLRGHTFALNFTDFELTLYLSVVTEGFELSTEYSGEIAVTLSGSLMSFVNMARNQSQGINTVSKGRIRMEGDAELGQALQHALKHYDLDFEELVARFTGDALAHKLGVLSKQARSWAKQSRQRFEQSSAEVLQEEWQWLPTRLSFDTFAEDIDTLRADTDRLQARIQRLSR